MATPDGSPRKKRRALSHVGGKVELEGGSEAARRALESALAVEADERATLAHVHGFHSYPAKLHPDTAGTLVEALSPPSGVVLDPFCGSGTVLVEALRRGRHALGVDANPLAIELAWLKTHAARAKWLGDLPAAAERVAAHAEERRARKAGPTRRYGREDRELFATHVLLELDGLQEGIALIEVPSLRRALALVLSSLLTKVSAKSGDSSERQEPKRLAGGYTIRLFARKAAELHARVRDLEQLLPEQFPPARVRLGDARDLGFVRSGSVDLIVSSPPYAGVYDYFEHHKLRLRWLGLEARQFELHEIGSRRKARAAPHAGHALERFESDFAACLAEMRRVLAPAGHAALIVADSVLSGRAVYADELVRSLSAELGLAVAARAWQARPYFHEPTRRAFQKRPRAEHLILLARAPERRGERRATPRPPSRAPRRDGRDR